MSKPNSPSKSKKVAQPNMPVSPILESVPAARIQNNPAPLDTPPLDGSSEGTTLTPVGTSAQSQNKPTTVSRISEIDQELSHDRPTEGGIQIVHAESIPDKPQCIGSPIAWCDVRVFTSHTVRSI